MIRGMGMTDEELSEGRETKKEENQKTTTETATGWKSKLPLLVITILLVSLGSTPFIIDKLGQDDNGYHEYGSYEIAYTRTYSIYEEKTAIETAENLEYANYLNLERLSGDLYSRYIDSVTILHFLELFLKAKENGEKADIEFAYEAEAKRYTNLDFIATKEKSKLELEVNGVNLSYHHRLYGRCVIAEIEDGILKARYDKDNELEIDYRYSKSIYEGFVVTIRFVYDNVFGPLGATFNSNLQTVILDRDYMPLFIVSEYSHAIS
jgi:hypothetical protein